MVKKNMDETKKGFMQNNNDLSFKKIDETNFEFSIKVEEKFLNKANHPWRFYCDYS